MPPKDTVVFWSEENCQKCWLFRLITYPLKLLYLADPIGFNVIEVVRMISLSVNITHLYYSFIQGYDGSNEKVSIIDH